MNETSLTLQKQCIETAICLHMSLKEAFRLPILHYNSVSNSYIQSLQKFLNFTSAKFCYWKAASLLELVVKILEKCFVLALEWMEEKIQEENFIESFPAISAHLQLASRFCQSYTSNCSQILFFFLIYFSITSDSNFQKFYKTLKCFCI